MHILRGFGLVLMILVISVGLTLAGNNSSKKKSGAKKSVQQLVEDVDIQGNRRLKDRDLLYYIRTRQGDTFSKTQVERDLKELLSFNWFDKTQSRVFTEPGVRGGVKVIFEVKELPIIRDLQFEGAKAIQESDILKAFREKRVGISKEAIFDPVKTRVAKRILREMLASKGYPNAKVEVKDEIISATSVGVTFNIDQGHRSRIVKISFEGNKHFKDGELRKQLKLVKTGGLMSRFKGQDILHLAKLQHDLRANVREYMSSKGYFQARIGEPKVVGLGYKRTGFPIVKLLPLPLVTSKDDTLKVIVPITEGKVFRVGEVKIEGNSIFSEQIISQLLGLKKGEIANGKRLRKALFEDLERIYGNQGFVEYEAELDPQFKDNPDNPEEGIVDIGIRITEGKQYRLRRLEFIGNTFTRDKVLRREVLINEGDIYNQSRLEISIQRINQLQYFDPIDKDQDLEVRTNPDEGFVDTVVKVAERGKQQISFNGGVSGIGGSFFGLTYSTNNLFGQGESLSFSFAAGNRQRSFQFSFQEPYFRDRPVSVGFSLFTSRSQFFGQGTFFSNNIGAIQGAINPFGSVTAEEDFLFTQTTNGGSFFATAALSEFFFKKRRFSTFSRVGLSYQFSATTIKDPKVNESADPDQIIPRVFAQPNITTSRITPTFVYDTRQPSANGIDTLRGTQLSMSFPIAGLGGDVRTYSPSITFSKFIPVRRKRSKNAQVFAFRIQAATVGSFLTSDKIKNANSLSFVGGVPLFERHFLGSEFDIRGYNVRSIGPVVPFDTFLTTRDVRLSTTLVGDVVTPQGLSAAEETAVTQLATFTGADGVNPLLFRRSFQFVGGDTRLLGNFEYRVPIFGPLSIAAFADVGTVFNLRKTGTQNIDSTFLDADRFVGPTTLTLTTLLNNPNLERSFGAVLFDGTNILSASQFETDFCGGVRANCPLIIPASLTPLFIRGEAQTNARLRTNDAVFDSFKDYKASVGFEVRIQVPIVNVPFRLIYFYNPNARLGFIDDLPGIFLRGKKSGFRFSVGRTF